MKILQQDLKDKLQEYSFLLLVAPLAAAWTFGLSIIIETVSKALADERDEVEEIDEGASGVKKWLLILMGGPLAFAVNVASIGVSKRVLATSMGVMGNAKRALTIFASMLLVERGWTLQKLLGIVVTLCGATWYAYRKEMKRNRKLK